MGFKLPPMQYATDEKVQYGQRLLNLKEIRVGAGTNIFYTTPEGSRWGSMDFATAPAWIKPDGSYKFKDVNGNTLIDSSGAGGNFINVVNANLDTQTKQILGAFTFGVSGAISIQTDANNGVWISPTGILGKKAGATTFAIDNGGNATFGGALVAATGTFAGSLSAATGTFSGTVSAGAVIAANISADLINAGTLQGRNVIANGGTGIDLSMNNDGYLRFKYGGSNIGYVAANTAGSVFMNSNNDIGVEATNILALYAGDSIQMWFNKDGGSDVLGFVSGSSQTVVGTIDKFGNLFVSGEVSSDAGFRLPRFASPPGAAAGNQGFMYFDTTVTDICFSNGTDWYKITASLR